MKLYAPLTYWEATPEERAKVCNGCGAEKGIKVPSTFYGLCIKEACNIHDWMYNEGKTLADKLFADAMFRLNITLIIDSRNHCIVDKMLSPLRHLRAGKYYLAVAEWGNTAYWVNKTINPTMQITYRGEFR